MEDETEGQRRLRESPLTYILQRYWDKPLPQDLTIPIKAALPQDFPTLTTINPTPSLT